MRLRPIVLGLALVLPALPACTGSGPDSDPSTWPSQSMLSPSPSGPPPETADGTDYDACYDGECEVLLGDMEVEIPMDPGLPPQISLVTINAGAHFVSVDCESARLMICFVSHTFIEPEEDLQFDTTVGLIIDMQRKAGEETVVTFSLS